MLWLIETESAWVRFVFEKTKSFEVFVEIETTSFEFIHEKSWTFFVQS